MLTQNLAIALLSALLGGLVSPLVGEERHDCSLYLNAAIVTGVCADETCTELPCSGDVNKTDYERVRCYNWMNPEPFDTQEYQHSISNPSECTVDGCFNDKDECAQPTSSPTTSSTVVTDWQLLPLNSDQFVIYIQCLNRLATSVSASQYNRHLAALGAYWTEYLHLAKTTEGFAAVNCDETLSSVFSTGYNCSYLYRGIQRYAPKCLEFMATNNYTQQLLTIPVPQSCNSILPGNCEICGSEYPWNRYALNPTVIDVYPMNTLDSDGRVRVFVHWETHPHYSDLNPNQDLSTTLDYYLFVSLGETHNFITPMLFTAKRNNVTLRLTPSQQKYIILIKTYNCGCGLSFSDKEFFIDPDNIVSPTETISPMTSQGHTKSLVVSRSTITHTGLFKGATLTSHSSRESFLVPSSQMQSTGATSDTASILTLSVGTRSRTGARSPSIIKVKSHTGPILTPSVRSESSTSVDTKSHVGPSLTQSADTRLYLPISTLSVHSVVGSRSTSSVKSKSLVTPSPTNMNISTVHYLPTFTVLVVLLPVAIIVIVTIVAFVVYQQKYRNKYPMTSVENTPDQDGTNPIDTSTPTTEGTTDNKNKKVLLIYSMETCGKEKETILECLVNELTAIEGITVRFPEGEGRITNMSEWIELETRKANTILCVCDENFQQDWFNGETSTSPVSCFRRLNQLYHHKMAVVFLPNSLIEYIPSDYLKTLRTFCIPENMERIAYFIKEEPEFEARGYTETCDYYS